MKKPGRPLVYTQKKKEYIFKELCELIKNGLDIQTSCLKLGLNRSIIYNIFSSEQTNELRNLTYLNTQNKDNEFINFDI